MKSKTFRPKYRGIAVFDLDGVLADFEGAFCDAFGYDNRELYSLGARYPEQADTVSEWVNEPVNYLDLAPIFGGVLWMNQIIGAGYYVAIVTARHLGLPIETKVWLDKYNIQPHDVIHTADKVKTMKMLSEEFGMPIILFVDDSVEQLQKVRGSFPETKCVAWSQPWNEGWTPRAWYDPEKLAIIVQK